MGSGWARRERRSVPRSRGNLGLLTSRHAEPHSGGEKRQEAKNTPAGTQPGGGGRGVQRGRGTGYALEVDFGARRIRAPLGGWRMCRADAWAEGLVGSPGLSQPREPSSAAAVPPHAGQPGPLLT